MYWITVVSRFTGGIVIRDLQFKACFRADLKQPSRLNVTSEASALYRRLHAYVRQELKRIYGPHRLPVTGHLPAHFVGMWLHQQPEQIMTVLFIFLVLVRNRKQWKILLPNWRVSDYTQAHIRDRSSGVLACVYFQKLTSLQHEYSSPPPTTTTTQLQVVQHKRMKNVGWRLYIMSAVPPFRPPISL